MVVTGHRTEFAGYRIQPWNEGPLGDLKTTGYRISKDRYDDEGEPWEEMFDRFLSQPHSDQLQAFVVGAAYRNALLLPIAEYREILLQRQHRLPNLKALFMADIVFEEFQISWINQTDLGPLLAAFPHLTHVTIRGGRGFDHSVSQMRLTECRHAHLHTLTIESGGLPRDVLIDLQRADLPELVELDVWTGREEYGWNGSADDLRPIVRGEVFPNLKRLGICNSEVVDEVVAHLVEGPLFPRLEHLDLSLGLLTDVGARYLLDHPATRSLKTLDVQHHYCSLSVKKELEGLREAGVNVLIDDPQEIEEEDDGFRYGPYTAVGE